MLTSRCSSRVFFANGRVGLVDDGRTLGSPQTTMISGAWPPPSTNVCDNENMISNVHRLTSAFSVIRVDCTISKSSDGTWFQVPVSYSLLPDEQQIILSTNPLSFKVSVWILTLSNNYQIYIPKRNNINNHLDVILFGNIQAIYNSCWCWTPIFMQFQSASPSSYNFFKCLRTCIIPLSCECKVHRKAIRSS